MYVIQTHWDSAVFIKFFANWSGESEQNFMQVFLLVSEKGKPSNRNN